MWKKVFHDALENKGYEKMFARMFKFGIALSSEQVLDMFSKNSYIEYAKIDYDSSSGYCIGHFKLDRNRRVGAFIRRCMVLLDLISPFLRFDLLEPIFPDDKVFDTYGKDAIVYGELIPAVVKRKRRQEEISSGTVPKKLKYKKDETKSSSARGRVVVYDKIRDAEETSEWSSRLHPLDPPKNAKALELHTMFNPHEQ